MDHRTNDRDLTRDATPDFDQLDGDAVRRALRSTEAEHRATLRPFAAALDEAFDPESGTSDADRSRLLGMPDRRGFLKIGGLSFGLAALAAACVEPKAETQLAQTGTLPAVTTTLVKEFHGSPTMDATLVLTAISLEKLAVEVYKGAGEFLSKQLLQEVATYFGGQHQDHAELLIAQANRMGQKGDEVGPNQVLKETIVDPQLETIKAAPSKDAASLATLKLAWELEDAAAQTYTKAGGLLTTPALRQAILSIGSIEAKHYSLIAYVLAQPEVPFSFMHTSGAAPADSYIQPNGPVAGSSSSETGTTGTTR